MTNDQQKINQLLNRLELLLKRQDDFSKEINELRLELEQMKGMDRVDEVQEIQEVASVYETVVEQIDEKPTPRFTESARQTQKISKQTYRPKMVRFSKLKVSSEKFIGENLINKIGIAITVIGVGIGAKYSIDHDLISPLTRIILGYVTGIGLLGIGIRLKEKYENYSAVLVSGAMAIMYFITFAAYSYYDLIPQWLAFALMVVFTVFTVIAALRYNRQVIAHIGLVGAYAVPFLLSNESGKVAILLSYITIINAGILVISFRKYWKPLYYASFILTWLIFFSWYVTDDKIAQYFTMALVFLIVFFATFYVIFLAYKLLQKEKYKTDDTLLLFVNSFIFFGIGYDLLNHHQLGQDLLGLFTLCNAIVHFTVSMFVYKQKLADKHLFYLIAGLVLVFITIAIPVQLDGNWVTLLWVGEAALLFWIGRTKQVPFYENLSYLLMIIAFLSIIQDWMSSYGRYYAENPDIKITPLFNIYFLTSLLFIAALGYINLLDRNAKYTPAIPPEKGLGKIISFMIPTLLLLSVYYAFRLEIANYWDQRFVDSALEIQTEGQSYPQNYYNYDYSRFRMIWVINYSLFFVSALAILNSKKWRNQQLGSINLGLVAFGLVVFLTQGLFVLSELRESYLEQSVSEYYHRGIFNIIIRYISFLFLIFMMITSYRYIQQDFIRHNVTLAFKFILHTAVLWILSSELIHWMDIADSSQSYKLGLSILWGSYSLFLIVLGIWKKKKPLRIGAIVLFGITLIKLFFYDISHLDTIAKTIVFVSLGSLLLIISFLYNKYKHIISDEIDN